MRYSGDDCPIACDTRGLPLSVTEGFPVTLRGYPLVSQECEQLGWRDACRRVVRDERLVVRDHVVGTACLGRGNDEVVS